MLRNKSPIILITNLCPEAQNEDCRLMIKQHLLYLLFAFFLHIQRDDFRTFVVIRFFEHSVGKHILQTAPKFHMHHREIIQYICHLGKYFKVKVFTPIIFYLLLTNICFSLGNLKLKPDKSKLVKEINNLDTSKIGKIWGYINFKFRKDFNVLITTHCVFIFCF